MVMHIPTDVATKLREFVAAGRYGDESEVLRAAIAALEARDEDEQLRHVRTLVLEGFARGDSRELTLELMEELDREAMAALQRGERPDPHVCP